MHMITVSLPGPHSYRVFALGFALVCWEVAVCNGYKVGNNPFHRVESLDNEGRYLLEWLVDRLANRVVFNVSVETKGFVEFGLSADGDPSQADIVIGGVYPNGKAYFSDRHGAGNQLPVVDESQDWELHAAWESHSHTFISFSRAFDTCDTNDYPITESRISLIWAYGASDDDATLHYQNSGTFNVHLLHPDFSPRIIREHETVTGTDDISNENLQLWTLSRRRVAPPTDTAYLCTIHKGLVLPHKHHIVGLEVSHGTPQSADLTHHIELRRCHVPRGVDPNAMFKPFLDHPDELCYNPAEPVGNIPTHYCTEFFHGSGKNARSFFNPPHIGIPFGSEPDEYYMLQVHYDNPNLVHVVVDIRLNFFFTSQLRPYEGGLLGVGHEVPGTSPAFMVPPKSISHEILGHCSKECTSKILPKEGINVYGIVLHAHNSGRRMTLQHFRGNQELPWIAWDDNFSPNYQPSKNMPEEVNVLPGDQLVMRCVYDNTWTNETTTGGYASRQEMCLAFVFYYNRIDGYINCRGEPRSEDARRQLLGITDIEWDDTALEYAATGSQHLQGYTVTEISDSLSWDNQLRTALQKFHLDHPQTVMCPRELYATWNNEGQANDGNLQTLSTYPIEAYPYQREPVCKNHRNPFSAYYF